MIEMPVVRNAVVRAVLAHGGDDDPVRQLKLGESQGRKQGTGHAACTDRNRERNIRNCSPNRQAGSDLDIKTARQPAAAKRRASSSRRAPVVVSGQRLSLA